jgi:hypothetical protein
MHLQPTRHCNGPHTPQKHHTRYATCIVCNAVISSRTCTACVHASSTGVLVQSATCGAELLACGARPQVSSSRFNMQHCAAISHHVHRTCNPRSPVIRTLIQSQHVLWHGYRDGKRAGVCTMQHGIHQCKPPPHTLAKPTPTSISCIALPLTATGPICLLL